MLTRIVIMTLREEEVEAFLAIFEENASYIRHQEGCHSLALHRDEHLSNRFYTLSHWESEVYLNQYRRSVLFGKVWRAFKALFKEAPQAYSLQLHTVV